MTDTWLTEGQFTWLAGSAAACLVGVWLLYSVEVRLNCFLGGEVTLFCDGVKSWSSGDVIAVASLRFAVVWRMTLAVGMLTVSDVVKKLLIFELQLGTFGGKTAVLTVLGAQWALWYCQLWEACWEIASWIFSFFSIFNSSSSLISAMILPSISVRIPFSDQVAFASLPRKWYLPLWVHWNLS